METGYPRLRRPFVAQAPSRPAVGVLERDVLRRMTGPANYPA